MTTKKSKLYQKFLEILIHRLMLEPIKIDFPGFPDDYQWDPPKVIIKDKKRFGIYQKREKLALSCMYEVIYPIVDSRLSMSCIGGRRGFGFARWIDWLELAKEKRLYWVLKTDIDNYFASINHRVLSKILRERFRLPNDVCELLFKLLSLGVGEEEPKGILCGNPLGKLLGNVYIFPLDEFLTKKSVFFVRFIDDICVFVKKKEQAETLLCEIRRFCKDELQLDLSENKTGIYHMFYNRFDFLGFEIVGNCIRPSKTNIERFVKKIRELPDSYRKAGVKRFLRRINTLVYHFAHLYKRGSVSKLFLKLDEVVRNSFRRYIRQSGKYRLLDTQYKNPEKFPENLAFSNRMLSQMGLVSLYEIKRKWDNETNSEIYGNKNRKEEIKQRLENNPGENNSRKELIETSMKIPQFIAEAHSRRFDDKERTLKLIEEVLFLCNKVSVFIEQLRDIYQEQLDKIVCNEIIKRYSFTRHKILNLYKAWKNFEK